MSKQENALRLALEALEDLVDAGSEAWGSQRPCVYHASKAITACREALAQPAGERGELLPCPFCGGEPTTTERPDNIDGTEFFFAVACYCGRYSASAHKMAVRKTPDQAKQDAIEAWNTRAALLSSDAQPSEWVSISDDEIYGMYNEPRSDAEMVEFARELESKLKEKNHGK